MKTEDGGQEPESISNSRPKYNERPLSFSVTKQLHVALGMTINGQNSFSNKLVAYLNIAEMLEPLNRCRFFLVLIRE